MKRKFMMLGFAMITGLPHAVCAKGFGKEDKAQTYSTWNTPYAPHYGSQSANSPLMDHLSSPSVDVRNGWQMDFSAPRVEHAEAGNPVYEHSKDKRFGIRFKLSF